MKEEAHTGSGSADESDQKNADPDDSLLGVLATLTALCQVCSGQYYLYQACLQAKGTGGRVKQTLGRSLTGLLGIALAGVQGASIAEEVTALLEVGRHDSVTLGKERHLCYCQRWLTS